MGGFAYKALDGRQEPHDGTITADTLALARQALRNRGLWIASIGVIASEEQSVWRRIKAGHTRWSRKSDEQVAELRRPEVAIDEVAAGQLEIRARQVEQRVPVGRCEGLEIHAVALQAQQEAADLVAIPLEAWVGGGGRPAGVQVEVERDRLPGLHLGRHAAARAVICGAVVEHRRSG